MSDELLDRLSADLRPARKGLVLRRLAIGLLAGGLVTFVGVAGVLGLRPDMGQAVFSSMFWMKLAYTVAIAALGIWAIERLSRPGGDVRRRLPWLMLPLAVIGVLAAVQFGRAPPTMRMPMVMGVSALICPWLILAAAVPLLAALTWALRGLAPTRLRLTGAVAGLAAGGVGASLYALHCPEHTMLFIGIWYTLGMAFAGALGALVGPWVLRWR